MCQAKHLAGIDIFIDRVSLAGPALSESIAEWSNLGDEISVGDLEGPACSDFGELGGVKLGIVVVGCALSQVCDDVIPCPLLATILLPIIEGRLAAGDPSEVVGAAASTQNLTTSVWLFNTLVVLTLDHSGLVSPVILATSEVKGLGWGGDVLNLLRVAAQLQSA